jgi:NADPH:quinone reductase-like Zn-dependent oxidoreductase
MRAAGIDKFGGPVKRITLPPPRSLETNEVLIDVMAAGVGNGDEFVRLGQWDIGTAPPMALGVEAAGAIRAVGESVGRWSVGDAVVEQFSGVPPAT